MRFVTEAELKNLPSLSREQLDGLEYGVVKVEDDGSILIYNRYESLLANMPVASAEGRNFFTQVAPCTDNRLFFGRFTEGVLAGTLDLTFAYNFTYKMRPTTVDVQIYRDAATKTNWLLIKKKLNTPRCSA